MTDRRDELALFLRSRRERIAPADVGLPPGLRRRTPGLRREEVAQLAGVGVTWYTWLEQGRSINASVQVLDAIARTLRLDAAERQHLYHLADVPTVPETVMEALPAEVQTILDSMSPIPAVVYNGRWDVLAWNDAYAAIVPGLCAAPAGERNVLWHMFTVPPCCSVVGNLEQEQRSLVATFRGAFARHLNEPMWFTLVERLTAASPAFAQLWASHEVAGLAVRLKLFLCVTGREIRTTALSLAISAAPETRIVAYTPVDDESRRRVGEAIANPPGVRRCAIHAAKHAEASVSIV